MYWLLNKNEQEDLRKTVDKLVSDLSVITGNPQQDQLFPYVGRKDRRKSTTVISNLAKELSVVVEPFAGSGTFVYSCYDLNKKCLANEWEPYVNRMANAPFRLPNKALIDTALKELKRTTSGEMNVLYKTICPCGNVHVLDSLFFDREPLNYKDVEIHERLGENGETITYRGKYKCSVCGRTEKHFDETDEKHMKEISLLPIPKELQDIFNTKLIENSRINLSKDFLVYRKLFPHRSILALCLLWKNIHSIPCKENVLLFLEDAFLAILPQAKFKDYRSKSQDLHCPKVKLREVNIWYRYLDQVEKRFDGLKTYGYPKLKDLPIKCLDYRDFLRSIDSESVDLIITDPPWTDGNAYFEKAQLYHPWLGYKLSKDKVRLQKEFVVTDAPSRKEHNQEHWWTDIATFFEECARVLKPLKFISLFFRPIPASKWLENLNRLKLVARKAGFEPLLSIDVDSSDPSMRIQQSASYVFSQDIIFLFLKLPEDKRRLYIADNDVDQMIFQTAEKLQEELRNSFSYKEWRNAFAKEVLNKELSILNSNAYEDTIHSLFLRYCDEVSPGYYLPKPVTPFSGQLFDTPAIERIFTYTPLVIKELLKENDRFSYERFLLRLAGYVENGTRALIKQIQEIDIKASIELYAIPEEGGRWFKARKIPALPKGLKNILEFDPYEFEKFIGKLLEAQGYHSIAVIGRAGDRGVDLIALSPGNNLTVVQCKRYFYHKVSSTPVQRLHSFSVTRGATKRILITTSDFTKQAREEAEITNTELINGDNLEKIVAQYLPNYFT